MLAVVTTPQILLFAGLVVSGVVIGVGVIAGVLLGQVGDESDYAD